MHLSTKFMGMAALATASALPGSSAGLMKPAGPVPPSQFPYHAAILHQGEPKCSGAIIYHNYVLTAAGCVAGGEAGDFTVRVGSYDAAVGGQAVGLSELRIHPLYVGDEGYYDLALLTLDQDLVYSDHVDQVNLPTRNSPSPEAGTPATVSGYTPHLLTLRSMDTAVSDLGACAEHYASTAHPIANTTLCAGFFHGQDDDCKLDVGAPLVDDSTGLLIGLAASLYGCVRVDVPGVYTSIPIVHSWIQIVTGL